MARQGDWIGTPCSCYTVERTACGNHPFSLMNGRWTWEWKSGTSVQLQCCLDWRKQSRRQLGSDCVRRRFTQRWTIMSFYLVKHSLKKPRKKHLKSCCKVNLWNLIPLDTLNDDCYASKDSTYRVFQLTVARVARLCWCWALISNAWRDFQSQDWNKIKK